MRPFSAVPGHPYASYRTYTDAYGRFWIECACSVCGPRGSWKKQCLRPGLADRRVLEYATMHGHGVRPT